MHKINFFFIFTLFLCCKSTIKRDSENFDEFPVKLEAKFDKVFSAPNNIVGLNIYEDSLLLIRNHKTYHHHFSLYNIGSKKKQGDVLGSGRAKNQSMGFISNGLQNHLLWVNDIIKEKVISMDLRDTSAIRQLPLQQFFYSVQVPDSDLILASGDYNSQFKLFKIDIKNGQLIDSLFQYPSNLKKADKMDYESFLFSDPSANHAALASRYSDQIEFFDINKRKSKVISGPENFVPELGRVKQGGFPISSRIAKTRYGFLGGKGKSKLVYLLFSGNNHNSKHEFYGNRIFVFNWQGNPIADIHLDRYIIDFDISADGKTLYAVDGVKNEILKSTINL